MKWKIAPWIFVAILLGVAFYAHFARRAQSPPQTRAIACADVAQGCAFDFRGQAAQVRFSRPPSAMQSFALTVKAPGARAVAVDFQMPDMDMGENRYVLKQVQPGVFTAENVVLPVCAHGGVSWAANLRVDEATYTLPFSVR